MPALLLNTRAASIFFFDMSIMPDSQSAMLRKSTEAKKLPATRSNNAFA
jgi:hypothetical protein